MPLLKPNFRDWCLVIGIAAEAPETRVLLCGNPIQASSSADPTQCFVLWAVGRHFNLRILPFFEVLIVLSLLGGECLQIW